MVQCSWPIPYGSAIFRTTSSTPSRAQRELSACRCMILKQFRELTLLQTACSRFPNLPISTSVGTVLLAVVDLVFLLRHTHCCLLFLQLCNEPNTAFLTF